MDHDAQQRREYQRQETVRKAIDEADRIILDASDGTIEQTNSFTNSIAITLLNQITNTQSCITQTPVAAAISKAKEIIDTHPEKELVVRNYLWMQVAKGFFDKVEHQFGAALLRWDIEHPATPEGVKI